MSIDRMASTTRLMTSCDVGPDKCLPNVASAKMPVDGRKVLVAGHLDHLPGRGGTSDGQLNQHRPLVDAPRVHGERQA